MPTFPDHALCYTPFMIRSFLTVSTGTLASRLLGFARDSMIAALLGAGPVADAFLVAFQLVNVVRRLLTEGALNAALVPAWLRVREAEGAKAAAAFAGRVLGTVSAALIVATALIGLLMPFVIAALAPGFAGQATLQLAVDNARLMLPYLAFAGPVTVMMALMNAQGRFALTAFSPLLFNIALIAVDDRACPVAAGCDLCRARDRRHRRHRRAVAAFDPGAAPWRRRRDPAARFVRRRDARLFRQGDPRHDRQRLAAIACRRRRGHRLVAAVGGVVAVFRQSPDRTAARHCRRRHGHGAGAGTDARAAGKDHTAVAQAESRALELAVGLALPATLGLIVLASRSCGMLFEHGAFTAADTAATARALMWLALGLPAHVLVKALSPAFFARDDTLTPLLATLKGFAVAIVSALVLGQLFGAEGIAAGIALGAWSNALALIRRGAATLRIFDRCRGAPAAAAHRGGGAGDGRAVVAGGAVPAGAETAHTLMQAISLMLLISGAIAVYGLFLALFGVIRLGRNG